MLPQNTHVETETELKELYSKLARIQGQIVCPKCKKTGHVIVNGEKAKCYNSGCNHHLIVSVKSSYDRNNGSHGVIAERKDMLTALQKLLP